MQKEISQRTGEITVYDEIVRQKTRFALHETEEMISEKEKFYRKFAKEDGRARICDKRFVKATKQFD